MVGAKSTDCIAAIDQGTTGSTAMIIDRAGRVLGRAYSEFRQYYPKPGWVEHDPDEIWRVTVDVLKHAVAKAGIDAEAVGAIGITNQRETTVVWDAETGRPVHRAIVWQCRRTAPLCNELKEDGHEETVRGKTGLVIDAYFSGTKVRWILDNVAGARDRAEQGELRFGTIDTWLIWKLTGGREHLTDYTNASRTMLYNIEQRCWDADMLEILRVPESMLPEVRPSSGDFGKAEKSILGREIPITGVAGDQQAALFGQLCTEPGLCKNTYGTGCFALSPTPQRVRSKHGLITTLACDSSGGPTYAIEGSVFIAGAAIQWLRDELKLLDSSADSEYFASKVSDTAGVYLVPAFVGLGAPYWDMEARGILTGITRGTNRYHIIRAALESIAYQSADLIKSIDLDLGEPAREIRVDGGASMNDLLMQFQADMLGIPVNRPVMVETTALGAAFLAGLHVGLWDNSSQLANVRKVDRVFEPSMPEEKRVELLDGWKRAVERARSKT